MKRRTEYAPFNGEVISVFPTIQRGMPLLEVNLESVRSADYSTLTPVLLTGIDGSISSFLKAGTQIKNGDVLFDAVGNVLEPV